ncbi:unnamed protein product [Hydatigera taeniaeformis]|uniref:Serum response factor-binding protein 1 n=1 Tax=Hydatigena taeniaeformis TaxID=6205 RepID=A0A0R3X2V0_HYDTA|nr:unnamed protein product [Hydatigera taeniaeformis]
MPLTYGIDDDREELSADVIQLNNIVLSLRRLIKKGRVSVLRELASCIKRQKLKQSRAPEEKGKRLGRKIVNKLAEIRLLRKISDIKLCKLVLSNMNPHYLLETGGENLTMQDRVVIRLAARPEISEFIRNFRTQHTDWPILVRYLLYKNTSGKWKTSDQKRRPNKRRKGDLPFPLVDPKEVESNPNASTIQEFREYKEKNDRELLAAQRRLLLEDAEDEDRKLENKRDGKSENPNSIYFDNSEMKVFISDLIAKMESEGDIDEYLVPGGGDDDGGIPTEAVRTGVAECLAPLTDEAADLAAPPNSRGREVKKMAKPPVKKIPKTRDSLPRLMDKSVDYGIVAAPLNSKTDANGVTHETIVEEVGNVFNQQDTENILGQDDVEMRKEPQCWRTETFQSSGLATVVKPLMEALQPHTWHGKASKLYPVIGPSVQRRQRTKRSTCRQTIRERRVKLGGAIAKGRISHRRQVRNFRPSYVGPAHRHSPTKDKTETPLHPSWAAKREQKALLSKTPVTGTRIVFSDE